ncbi:hypothetical protein OKW27_002751 [Paraburkholderia sp. 35.1]
MRQAASHRGAGRVQFGRSLSTLAKGALPQVSSAARPVAQATTEAKQKRGESEQMISRASQQAVSKVAAHC